MTATIIYVSSNRQDPGFERKTRDNLIQKAGDLTIISVTQKPVKLGINICVGDVGVSGYNFCRQNLIALEQVKTDVVISAESDCLYSPDYFQFRPKRLDIPYRNTNIYVQKYGKGYFCKKNISTFAQVVGKEYYMNRLKFLLGYGPTWNTKMKNFPKEIGEPLFETFDFFETRFPCLSFKVEGGMRKHSNTDEIPVYDLPYWGKTKILIKKYTCS